VIRGVLVLGWVGIALFVVTAIGGYQVATEETAQRHLMLSLFPCGVLLLTDLCVLIYVAAVLRLVRRTAEELALSGDWLAGQRAAVRGTAALAAAGIVSLTFVFGSGFPAYAQRWPMWLHHAGAIVAMILQVAFLMRAAPALKRGERRLVELGAAVEARAASG
jgi:hypothetical protein